MATLIGTPTAGALVPTFSQAHFDHLIIFTGVLSLAGGGALGLAYLVGIHQEKRTEDVEKEETLTELNTTVTYSGTSTPNEALAPAQLRPQE